MYWKPVWHILSDGDVELVLANARHVKNVPGRKSDVSDAAWQSDLLAHGLIRASFVPDGATQELRGLLRTRKQLVQERTRHIQRLQKTLEDANIKLDSTISDLLGRSGRAMIEALIAGETDPDKLAALADGRIKASQARLREALRGRVTKQHCFLLRLHLRQIDGLSEGIADIDREVETRIEPFRKAVELLSSIPGVSTLSAQVIIAEIGLDMSRFPTVGHLLSWAGLCPKSDESAGKRRSTRMRKGAPWLKTNLIQCAWAAKNAKRTYLQAQFYRVRAQGGQEGGRSRGSLDPHRSLPHAPAWRVLPGPRPRALRAQQGRPGETPRQASQEPRLCRRLNPHRRMRDPFVSFQTEDARVWPVGRSCPPAPRWPAGAGCRPPWG